LIERGYNLDIACSTRVGSLNEDLLKKMRRSGFRWIGIGVESGNEEILNKISKNQSPNECSRVLHMIADNDIAIYGNLILGYPGENKKTLNDTLNFLLKNPIHFPQINIFVPYPGTPIYNELAAKGTDIPRNTNQFSEIVSYNKDISRKYLLFFLWYSYIRAFLRKKYFNLIRKTFKLDIFFFDLLKMGWTLIFMRRRKKKVEADYAEDSVYL